MKNDDQLWIVIYSHKFGIDAWPVWGTQQPDLDVIASGLDDFEED